jgi:alpha-galactosidase
MEIRKKILAGVRTSLFVSMLLGCMTIAASVSAHARDLAPTPPMGWNSWDSYGLTISEADYRANAKVLASLKEHGWSYAVVDMGWYMANPTSNNRLASDFQIDSNGLLVPAVGRYPSAAGGAGFKPLADWVHGLGLKFGIHIMRGIPRGAVEQNMPIAGSGFHAADAADTSDTCGWDDGNYGIRDNAAGQAYYDSAIQLYATWGVDFLKVDCIADHPYKAAEIRQIAAAIKKSERPILLSLSPGPTQLEHAAEISRHAQMWRISNDIWDGWHFHHDPGTGDYPSGVDIAFANLPKWNPYARRGAWPDADMLPLGSLRPNPGMGEPRESRLSHDEQRTLFNLLAITRSPLMLGANLTMLDPFTRSLVTNSSIIAINQTAWDSRPVADLPPGFDGAQVWMARSGPRSKPTRYIAFFNLKDEPAHLGATWKQLGIEGKHSAQDLWSGAKMPAASQIDVALPAHGSAVYRIR